MATRDATRRGGVRGRRGHGWRLGAREREGSGGEEGHVCCALVVTTSGETDAGERRSGMDVK